MQSSTGRRPLISGAAAGAGSPIVFAALHQLLISDIWFSLVPMLMAGALCGVCVAWSHHRLFTARSPTGWLLYNFAYVALLVLLGIVSFLVFEPIATIPALIAANGPPRELIREAMPLTVGFIVASATIISWLWGRKLLDVVAILLTCTVLVILLGLNVSILGLVYLPSRVMRIFPPAVGVGECSGQAHG